MLMKPSFWGETFFSKCSKKFSIGFMIMFKVCRRCLQRFPLRWKKNYERTIHRSKYLTIKSRGLNHITASFSEMVSSSDLILTDHVTISLLPLQFWLSSSSSSSFLTKATNDDFRFLERSPQASFNFLM